MTAGAEILFAVESAASSTVLCAHARHGDRHSGTNHAGHRPGLAFRRKTHGTGPCRRKPKGIKFARKLTLTSLQQRAAREWAATGDRQRSIAHIYNVGGHDISGHT
jgi:hypothetical protein